MDIPYIEGTKLQYAWDSTSIGYFKTCPRLYQYIMLEGWSSREESVHLRFGTELHRSLQIYDLLISDGVDHDDAVFGVVRDLLVSTADYDPDPTTKAGKLKSREALVRSVIWYLDEHRYDPASVHILHSGKPAVELSFRFELDYPQDRPFLLCGHLDKIVDFADDLYIMDHKTTTTTPGSYYFNQYDPNNQMSLYTLASQVVIASPVKGVIINAIQLLADSTRFVRGITYRTADQLEEWLNDLKRWLSLAEKYAADDYWPMNDTACDKFGGCRFREVCSKSPHVREQFLAARFTKLPPEERWNPLQTR